MIVWFWAAVAGAVFAGISNFYFKIAAVKNFSSELFQVYSGLFSIGLSLAAVFVVKEHLFGHGDIVFLIIFAGMIAASGGVMKTYALRYIDTTIFFPLFKLLSPALAVIFGLIFFQESFSAPEWIGIFLGLTVPLLLVNRDEHGRQSNLVMGIVLIIATAVVSATAAGLNKYAIVEDLPFIVVLLYASIGVFIGSVLSVAWRHGVRNVLVHMVSDTTRDLLWSAFIRSVLICTSMALVLFAYNDGTLGVVQTIHSLYILIPIVLAIIFYNEHWNARKVIAIVLSFVALLFFH